MCCNIIVTPEFSRSLKKLAIYDKSERENLSDKELKDLLYRYSL